METENIQIGPHLCTWCGGDYGEHTSDCPRRTPSEQQAPEPRPDEDGHCTRCGLLWEEDELSGATLHLCPPGFLTPIVRQQAPGLDWDAASRKMIEQAQPARGTVEMQAWGYPPRTEAARIEFGKLRADLAEWADLWSAVAAIEQTAQEAERRLAALRAELASSQHGYKLLADHAEKQAAEIAKEQAICLDVGLTLHRANEEIKRLKYDLENKSYEPTHNSTAEIAALKQRLEQSERWFIKAWDYAKEHPSEHAEGYDKKAFMHVQGWVFIACTSLAAEPPGGQQEQGET